ncbi:TRAP transporter large permease [Alkalibacillus salilacus]|uniref:C4-dicarboxylate transporter DctM subunit n=1 Tax=Alkalibacillus salilacus TaxID=284582 RepID=A0ABT9VAY9_9BACI|nr:TRAP transporter large permease [Alkalibacillus salilacus]MDQ0158128.1 C4-dicarboxylate transporter DctM subunit [Alkalibacillus salilacus]
MDIILLFGVFFLLIALKVPIAIAIAATSIVTLFNTDGVVGLESLADIMYTGISKFTLLAIPFFILTGVIMEHAGISKRLINLAQTIVGHYKSGIVFITAIAAIFFAAISGSGPATVAAIGGILIPALVKNGYKKETASALVASAGSTGIVIPPSIAFIVFAVVAGDQMSVSIGDLFMAGVIPGVLLGIAFIIATLFVRWRNDLKDKREENEENQVKEEIELMPKATFKEKAQAFYSAIWGLLIPIVILGGIYGGIFTPTEAAVVAVFYGLFVGFFVYRELKLKDMYVIFRDASVQTAVIMLIVGSASVFAHIITSERIANDLADMVLGLTENPIIILLLINLILLLAGAFIDAISAMYIFVPILMPIIIFLEVEPMAFAVFMTVNLAIGLFTPPVGINLFVACGISGATLAGLSKTIIPYFIAAFIVLLFLTFVPSISTFLPNLLEQFKVE